MDSPRSADAFLGALYDTILGREEAKPRQRISFLKHFESLRDPRVVGRSSHLLLDIIGITLCAVICGAESWEQVQTYAKDHYDFLKTLFALPHGIPSHDTFNRVFRHLDADAFGQCFADWINAL